MRLRFTTICFHLLRCIPVVGLFHLARPQWHRFGRTNVFLHTHQIECKQSSKKWWDQPNRMGPIVQSTNKRNTHLRIIYRGTLVNSLKRSEIIQANVQLGLQSGSHPVRLSHTHNFWSTCFKFVTLAATLSTTKRNRHTCMWFQKQCFKRACELIENNTNNGKIRFLVIWRPRGVE